MIFKILYMMMPEDFRKNVKQDSMEWKVITWVFVALSIFVTLQVLKLLFANSLPFLALSVVFTVLFIYIMERFQKN